MKMVDATIKGIEVMQRIGKGSFRLWVEAVGGGTKATFVNRLFGVYAEKPTQEVVTLASL